MFKISIKTHILTVFILLVGIVALSLLFLQYYFSQKLAVDTTHRTFKIISENIRGHVYGEALSVRTILKTKSTHKNVLEAITFDPFHPSFVNLVDILKIHTHLHAIYFSDAEHRFYEIIHIAKRPELYVTLKAPKETHWVIVTIINNQQQNAYLDENFKLLGKMKFQKKYDVGARPWHKKALASNKVVATMPYLFAHSHQMGVTYAMEIKGTGVVLALDYTMGQINDFLALQQFDKDSEVFLVDRRGTKFASSAFHDSGKLDKPQMLDTVLMQDVLDKKLNQIIKHKENGKNYFVLFAPLISKAAYLGIKVDADILFEPYKKSIEYSLFIALMLLLLALPIIWLSTNLIVKPIKALILENIKVQNRNFSEVNAIETKITEFHELSHSLVSLSQSVQSYEASQEELLDGIIKVIAGSIDTKSPYTGKHCERVPQIALLLLEEANRSTLEAFKDFSLTSKEERREFEIGAWLHDCGKVTTPEYVVDKSAKLETIYNRIHEIRMRFEVLWRDAHIAYLSKDISLEEMHKRQESLQSDFAFVASCNIGSEFMDMSKQERIKSIAKMTWERHFSNTLGLGPIEALRYGKEEQLPLSENLLSDKTYHIVKRENFDHDVYEAEGFKLEVPEYLYNYGEIYNLCIEKGTLSTEERYKINEHVIMSIRMLEQIPFPSYLTKIPEYAGTHHETLIGTGYPRGLKEESLSIPARIMAIADIFEALTASDRPYKKEKTLSESIKIMHQMVKDEHIDAALFKLFLSTGVYKVYAEQYLHAEQIDEVDVALYL